MWTRRIVSDLIFNKYGIRLSFTAAGEKLARTYLKIGFRSIVMQASWTKPRKFVA